MLVGLALHPPQANQRPGGATTPAQGGSPAHHAVHHMQLPHIPGIYQAVYHIPVYTRYIPTPISIYLVYAVP